MIKHSADRLPRGAWEAFRNGSQTAFQSIYEVYVHQLLVYGKKISPNQELIEDAVHDLFLELWKSREKLTDVEEGQLKFYLYKALRNRLYTAFKRGESNRTDVVSTENSDYFLFEEPLETHLIEEQARRELLTSLRTNLNALSARQQQAIYLRFYEHFSNEEIAQLMGVNYHSACRFIYSGLKYLKEAVRILGLSLFLLKF